MLLGSLDDNASYFEQLRHFGCFCCQFLIQWDTTLSGVVISPWQNCLRYCDALPFGRAFLISEDRAAMNGMTLTNDFEGVVLYDCQ